MLRYLLTLVIAAMIVLPSFGQSGDLEFVDVRISSSVNNLVPLGWKTPTEVIIRNNDSIASEAGDTIHLFLDFVGYETHEVDIILESDFFQGDSLVYQLGATSLFTFPDSSNVSVTIGGFIQAENDTNFLNNIYTEDFTTNLATSNDWATIDLEVLNPSNLDSFDIDNGTNVPPPLSEVTVTFENLGDLTYLEHTPFTYGFELNDDYTSVMASVNGDEITPGMTMTRTVSNPTVLPMIPDSVGTYELCAAPLMVIQDNVSVNDVHCWEFSIVDLFDPSDPANWPFGIEDELGEEITILQDGRNVRLVGIQEAVEVNAYDIRGSLIGNWTIRSESPIQLPAAQGMMIIQVLNDQGAQIAHRKVVLL